jgi:hypothetical protein
MTVEQLESIRQNLVLDLEDLSSCDPKTQGITILKRSLRDAIDTLGEMIRRFDHD